MAGYSDEFYCLPNSIQNLVKIGVGQVKPSRVILFGSRARGDARENSDFDIAFAGLGEPSRWSWFISEYQEEPITLRPVDLVIYEHASQDYRRNIDSEGVVLYEN